MENGTVARYRSNVFFNNRLVYSQLDIPGTTPDTQQFYVLEDHQGSVDQVVFAGGTNPSGDQEQFSFDAYGKRRNTDWTNNTNDSQFDATQWIERGYTGHEHLDNVRMIHMNGRVQEPIWGRMLSPDPVVGELTLPQSLNAYSYTENNPLSRVDPTGYDSVCDRATRCFIIQPGEWQLYTWTNRFSDGSSFSWSGWVWEPSPSGPSGDNDPPGGGGWGPSGPTGGGGSGHPGGGQGTSEDSDKPQGEQHKYETGAPTLCTAGEAFDNLKAEGMSAPGAPAAQEGFTPRINLWGMESPNPISQRVDSSTMTITNTTLTGHEFYPGDVNIQVMPASGNTSVIKITGTGTSSNPYLNDAVGLAFFGGISALIQMGCNATHGVYAVAPF